MKKRKIYKEKDWNINSPLDKDEGNEKSVGSSNAFEATERPNKENEKELSDEEIDELLDEEGENK